MSSENEYVIQYSGLKLGTHTFDFEIGSKFFESFEYSDIQECAVHVKMSMEKSSTMMVLLFDVEGKVEFPCDRCLEPVSLPIHGDYRQVVKFSDYEESSDEEIIILPTGEYEIDVKKLIYDFIMLSVPLKRAHEEGECDEELVEKLNDFLIDELPEEPTDSEENEDDIDPRWQALKDLKNKEN
ncbi:YceD family protein [Parvicella tangerina]|uniref:DUF177 domain-containing protein n=1 Tax=Parvicella tangerina TaxID=2829795 RepID=A0A916JJB5_9FLAO|nr:DUF177 domain-containing protein [Parvicella tangerina]CAG5076729.1 hypothetical protein CRYO30217_00183 [Parvicella tangerina]